MSQLYAEEHRDFIISSYSTSVTDQEEPVKTNIRIAASKLNAVEIASGETFSFNTAVGEGSSANGYLNGRVLYQDRYAYEPGGGICQVSSTLFNALLLSGCIIIERQRHSSPVTYVPLGLDATIRYGKKDLKMKNPHPHSIYVYTSINGSTLLVTIKSGVPISNTYELYTDEETMNIPFNNDSERRITPGRTVYVYRKKYKDNKLLETAMLYKDFYPPAYAK